jgi:hypothetical protein
MSTRENSRAHSAGPETSSVTRRLNLRFDEFGWQRLESESRRDGETLGDLLARAAAYFDGELATPRAATRVPRFKPGGRGVPREVRVQVSRECWEHLEGEAGHQDVSLEPLLEHAALLYLADLDSGRVANCLLGGAEAEEQ